MRRANCEYVAEAIESDLVLHCVDELAGDLVAGESPIGLHGTETWDDLLFSVDPLYEKRKKASAVFAIL